MNDSFDDNKSFDDLSNRLTICRPSRLSFTRSFKGFHSIRRPESPARSTQPDFHSVDRVGDQTNLRGGKTLRRTRFSARRHLGPLALTPLQTHPAAAKTMVCARKSNEYSFDFLAQNKVFDDVELKWSSIFCGSPRWPNQTNSE